MQKNYPEKINIYVLHIEEFLHEEFFSFSFYYNVELLIAFYCFWAPNPKYGIKMNLCIK